MTYLTLPVGSAVSVAGIQLSEHNRQPITLSADKIEQSQRMADGSLRKYFIANKYTINLSWNDLPSTSLYTVDGKYGALDIKSWYDSIQVTPVEVILKTNVEYGSPGTVNSSITFNGIVTAYSATVKRRGLREFGNSVPGTYISNGGITVTNSEKSKTVTAVSASSSGITYTAAGHSYIVGDKVTISGFDSDEFDVVERPITDVTTDTFTVAQTEGGYSVVTGANQTATAVTYYAVNGFEPGDKVTVSGLATKSISSISGNGTTVSITTSSAHGFSAGQKVSIVSTGVTALNLSSATIATVPSTTTLTITSTASGSASTGSISLDGFNLSNKSVYSSDSKSFTINNTGVNVTDVNSQSGTATIYGPNTQSSVTQVYAGNKITITEATSTASYITYTYSGGTVSNGQNVVVKGLSDSSFNVFGAASSATPTTFRITTDSASGNGPLSGESGTGYVGTGKTTYVATNNYNVGDLVSVSGIRGTATITDATQLSGSNSGKITFTTSTQASPIQAGDIVTISGCLPDDYNLENVQVVSSPAPTSTQFTIVSNVSKKFQSSGTASNVFNITDQEITSCSTSEFTIDNTVTSTAITGLTGITATNNKKYSSESSSVSVSSSSGSTYDLWDVALTIEQI